MTKVAIDHYRNVYTRFPLVPKSMTLSDPWPEFQGYGRQSWRFSAFNPPISQWVHNE